MNRRTLLAGFLAVTASVLVTTTIPSLRVKIVEPPASGDIWIDSDSKDMYLFDDPNWVPLTDDTLIA